MLLANPVGTKRRPSLQDHRTRRGRASRNPWRAVLRRRPCFPRASAGLSARRGRGCATRESDDAEVVPPGPPQAPRTRLSKPLEGDAPSAPITPARQRSLVFPIRARLRLAKMGRHGAVIPPKFFPRDAARERPSKPLEGDAPSAPIFAARQRGLVDRNGAGLRHAKIERHGGRPSEKFPTEAAREHPSKPLEGAAPSTPMFPARQRGLVGRMGAGLRSARIGRHGGRPSKGTAASGWLISRIASDAKAEVEAPIGCVVVVGDFGDRAVDRSSVPTATAKIRIRGNVFKILTPLS